MVSRMGHSGFRTVDIRFISNNILAYSPIGRGDVGMSKWNSLHDRTQKLGEFERLSVAVFRKVFMGS